MPDGLYEIDAIAGSGGHAIVVLARLRSRDERVALKVLRPQLANDVDLVARFTDEARMLLPIHHPDVIRVYRLLDYGGRHVIEMEPVEGVSVEQVLAWYPDGLPLAEALELCRRAARALHAVYAEPYGRDATPMRVVHRDVKPGNLLLSRDGGVKIVDFGIARAIFDGRRAKSLFAVPGSAGFLAPERRSGRDDHPASDVYALGCTLFLLATGRVLLLSHESALSEEAARRQLPHLPVPALVPLVARMVGSDPDARPTMEEVADALDAVMADEGLVPDLRGLARDRVAPILDRLRGLSLDDDLDAVRFLETERPSGSPTPLSARDASRAVRRLLQRPGWERRVPELERIVAAADGGGFEAPLLEVLERAFPRWWTPWVARATTDELLAALWVLGDHPTPAVVRRASALVDHPEDRVRRAARFVVGRRSGGA